MSDRFGELEIVRRLGVGGIAETFVARRVLGHGVEKTVALKHVLAAFGDDPRFVRMFQDEARLAVRLEHPQIAGVDFGVINRRWWMAMELVDGVDLRALLADLRERGERLPLPLAILVVADLAAALHYASGADARAAPATADRSDGARSRGRLDPGWLPPRRPAMAAVLA